MEFIKSKDKDTGENRIQVLYSKLKGNVISCCFQLEASKYVQAVVKFGPSSYKKAVLDELRNQLFRISYSKTGANVLCSLLKHGNENIRNTIVLEILPHTFHLSRSKVGSSIVDIIFRSYSSARIQDAFQSQVWGYFLDSFLGHKDMPIPAGLVIPRDVLSELRVFLKAAGVVSSPSSPSSSSSPSPSSSFTDAKKDNAWSAYVELQHDLLLGKEAKLETDDGKSGKKGKGKKNKGNKIELQYIPILPSFVTALLKLSTSPSSSSSHTLAEGEVTKNVTFKEVMGSVLRGLRLYAATAIARGRLAHALPLLAVQYYLKYAPPPLARGFLMTIKGVCGARCVLYVCCCC
ncbi:hypothetical protein FACS189472_14190 [Alphaproteobacteria bacterium]|nr:hypothetical protein FACS189472_14190 [Alphaproteobacteria bacterium]